jgi:hypothetical protein
MLTFDALIRKVRTRWQYYVLVGRWKRADRIRQLLDRLEQPTALLRRIA